MFRRYHINKKLLGPESIFRAAALVPPRLGKPPTTISQIFPNSTVTVAHPSILRSPDQYSNMAEQLILKGTLEGHSGWVTSLATSLENPNMLLSGSRDKSLIIWNLTRDETSYGYPKRSLHGHSHIVSDCVC